MRLQWTPAAMRDVKRAVRDDPALESRLGAALARLTADPHDPRLHTHKLRGPLADRWAASIDFDNRVLFRFEHDAGSGEEFILLLAIGSHDAVY